VYVKDLTEKPMTGLEDAQNILAAGQKNRQVAQTSLNQDSSRSHSVFTIKLIRVPKDKDKEAIAKDPSLIKYNKLSIVDLAGSERAKRTQNDGARLKEAASINTSLMTFGRCLEILRWNQKNGKQNPQGTFLLTRLQCHTHLYPFTQWCRSASPS
jgi:3D (Asp-Asp-Asp) domain-containing protein